jgi:hypothetical protein
MIQRKVLWREPEQCLREAQRKLKVQQNVKALASARASARLETGSWTTALDLPARAGA